MCFTYDQPPADTGADEPWHEDNEPWHDDDGDGYTDQVDCDDGDPGVHPGADELCNGIDDDCDGEVDGAMAAGASDWFRDQDGDGVGASDSVLRRCEAPTGYVADGGDCDEADATVYPGAPEVCDDGRINDCDGDASGARAACELEGDHPLDEVFRRRWTEADGWLGFSVALVGDVDGDGRADVALGDPKKDGSAENDGGVYLFTESYDASWRGVSAEDHLGWALSPAGDSNSDGYADFFMAAPGVNEGEGRIYLVLGAPEHPLDFAGRVSGAGYWNIDSLDGGQDWDQDGVVDLVVAGDDGAFLITAPLDGTVARDTAHFHSPSATRGAFGGDLNGDGLPDLLVGAPEWDWGLGSRSGAACVYTDHDAGTVPLSEAELCIVGEADDIGVGADLSEVGDVDNDGYDDLLISANGFTSATTLGTVAVFSGTRRGVLPISDAVFKVQGKDAASLGDDIVGAGDLDQDGWADIATSSYDWSGDGQSGDVHVWFGPLDGTFTSEAPPLWLRAPVSDHHSCFPALSGGQDTNADGHPDLLIGCYQLYWNSSESRAWLWAPGGI